MNYSTIKLKNDALFKTKIYIDLNKEMKKKLEDAYVQRGDASRKSTVGMIGPLHYFGVLKAGKTYKWILNEKRRSMTFEETMFCQQKKIGTVYTSDLKNVNLPKNILKIHAEWLDKTNNEIKDNQNEKQGEDNVFGKSGRLILPVDTFFIPKVNFFEYKEYIESFGFKLIENGGIICIPKKFNNDMMFVTYKFNENYIDYLSQPGKGAFLETHFFTQYFTPLTKNTEALMVAGKWVDEKKKELEIISFDIPYGYMLISSEHTIHGDSFTKGTMAVSFDVEEDEANVAYFRTKDYGIPKVYFVDVKKKNLNVYADKFYSRFIVYVFFYLERKVIIFDKISCYKA